MAFTDKTFDGTVINNEFDDNDVMLPCVYNLTASAGHGCANRTDDVLLVQGFVGFHGRSPAAEGQAGRIHRAANRQVHCAPG